MIAKISLGLSALLLVVTGYLLFKVQGSPAHSVSPPPMAAAFMGPDSARKPVVAYINGDTIMAQYSAFKEMENSLKSSLQSSSSRVQSEIDRATAESEELYRYIESQGDKLSQADAQAAQNKLMELEYQIQQLKASEQDKLLKKEAELNEAIMKKIREYLARYCAQHGIDMVFNYMELNQSLIYGNGAFDITASVLEGLNAEHEVGKK